MRSVTITLLLLCGVWAGPAAAQDTVTGADLLKHLAGTWKAPEDRTPKTSELDQQVFGPGANEVRTVTLVISPAGDGTLDVKRSVVSSKGKVFAPSLTEVKMKIGEPVKRELGHVAPTVTVTSAEERYLDGDHERWPRDGSRLAISLVDMTSNEINIQFDTPDGRGAFGATLTSAGTDPRSHRRPS